MTATLALKALLVVAGLYIVGRIVAYAAGY